MVEVAPGVPLLLRASWQPGPRESRPALLIVHGLGGSDRSSYVVSTGRYAYARGWHVIRMNMRGSGDGEALCPLLYNAGLDGDLLAAISAVSALVPKIAVVGFSLGGNLALLMLGRRRETLPRSLAGRRRRLGAGRPRDLRRRRSRAGATASTSTTSCGCSARPTGAATRRGRTSSAPAASSACARCASTTTASRPRSAATRAPRSTTSARARAPGSRRSSAPRCCWRRPTTR